MSSWESYWFREIPPDVYALLRIALGTVGLVGVLALTPVAAFWPAGGIMPEAGGGFGIRQQLESLGLGTVVGEGLFVALLVSFTCVAIGFHTSVALLAAWALSVVQARWNPLPLAGSHRVLITLLFPLLWTGCGRVLSIDAWRGRGAGSGTTGIWPLRVIRFQVALIYLNSGLSKLMLEPWRDGSAVHYSVSSNLFQRFPTSIPGSLEWVATLGTYMTLAWEIAFAFMLLHPWTRRLALGFGIALHVFMGTVMELGTFSLVMLASYLAFLDPDVLPARVAAVWGRRHRSTPEAL